jgi:hypothetical protein
MIPYRSTSGKPSGVTAYRIGADHIVVEFEGATYRYSYASCGKEAVEAMKLRAIASRGLSTYIARNDPPYGRKS